MQSLLHHPTLMDCRRLFLRNYEIRINIGVHAFEKTAEQRVVMNVDLYIPLAVSTPREDALEEVVDYDFIRSTIASRVGKGHIHLQETLCDDVLGMMLRHAILFDQAGAFDPAVVLFINRVGERAKQSHSILKR